MATLTIPLEKLAFIVLKALDALGYSLEDLEAGQL